MSDNHGSESELFSQLGKWLELGQQYNRNLVDNAMDQFSKPDQRIDAALSGLSSLSSTVMQNKLKSSGKLISNQLDLMVNHIELLESMFEKIGDGDVEPVIEPEPDDHRFTDDEWCDNPFFDYLKQSYLLNSQAMSKMTDCMNLEEADKERINYYTRQISSALSPTNFPLSNPEVVRKIQASKGENLFKGLQQFIEDQNKSGDFLNICMSDPSCFRLGEDLAATAGQVVFENALIQLIQYSPTTEKSYAVPLLMVPSWINKYYIFDLREKNSFVKWAVDLGLTVYMISWVNPDSSYRDCGFDDYLQQGLLTAVEQVKQRGDVTQVNCIGYCLGGTLLACAAAYLAKIADDSIATCTYLATTFDFENPGEIQVFLDQYSMEACHQQMQKDGFMDGRNLAISFSTLRENELYWNYYIQNYLKGERPEPFDILHWNSDSTNIPEKNHRFVLDEVLAKNALLKANTLSLLGETIDLSEIQSPAYILAAEKDHIAQWASVYPATQLFSGSCRFILSGSGHIAGVINPPASKKYHYYSNLELSESSTQWMEAATKNPGSWWDDWANWVDQYSGARQKTNVDVDPGIEPAPGRYVKRRLDEQVDVADAQTSAQTNVPDVRH